MLKICIVTKKCYLKLGLSVHPCASVTWEGKKESTLTQAFENRMGNIVRPSLIQKT